MQTDYKATVRLLVETLKRVQESQQLYGYVTPDTMDIVDMAVIGGEVFIQDDGAEHGRREHQKG